MSMNRSFRPPQNSEDKPPLTYSQAQNRALNLLAARARSEYEIRQALEQRNAPEDVIEQVVEWLVKHELIDDAAYGQSYARQQYESKGLARNRIERELRNRGLAEQNIFDATSQITNEDEQQRALELAQNRYRSMRSLEPEVARRRLYGFLMRKGYGHGVVMNALQEVLTSQDDEQGYFS